MSVARGSDEREIVEGIKGFLEATCRFLVWTGLLATLIGVGFLIFNIVTFTQDSTIAVEAALPKVRILGTVAMIGFMATIIGSAYLYWGEDWLGFVQVVAAAALYFAPLYAPAILSVAAFNDVITASLAELQRAGTPGGIVAVGVLLADLAMRIQLRMSQGVKADTLKYGKGIKEEVDRQNVFLGKCWQLPYCRKFVRDRCPIYHSRRTCWREKVGCMCEEEVIKGAMENRAIPKDVVAAARYIPRNHKLTPGQKKERCRQCVIFNEHQKHKYRALLPLMVIGFGVVYALGRPQLLAMTQGVVDRVNSIIGNVTYGKGGSIAPPTGFQEILTVCFTVVALAYALKVLEYLVFKLKV